MEEKIRKALNHHDPINLIQYGNSTEYIMEIKKINEFVSENINIDVKKLSEFICKVFSDSFQNGIDLKGNRVVDLDFNIGDIKIYEKIAEEILNIK